MRERVQEREAMIDQIHLSVMDMAALIKQIDSMIIQQGSALDRIDMNVEAVSQHLHCAADELVKVISPP